jgi:phosphoenolpyruvate carboxykinase (GTP)
MAEILKVDIEGWKAEIADVRANHYPKFGAKLPKELDAELEAIEKRLNG